MIITDEMAQRALSIATRRHEVGASDGGTYAVSIPTLETMRTALEAVLPMVCEEIALMLEGKRTSPTAMTILLTEADERRGRYVFVDDAVAAIRALGR